jgi:hypothetical protein
MALAAILLSGCRDGEREVLRLRTSPAKDDVAKEVGLAAGKPFYGLFIGADLRTQSRDGAMRQTTTTYEQCGVPFSFVFEDGAEYEVTFHRGRCAVEIARIAGAAKVAQSAGPMDFAACRKVFEKRRFF